MTHTWIISTIILIAGLLGGLTNFLLIYKTEPKSNEFPINFLKSILLGVCASATVPLFLQIIQTNLLEIQAGVSFPEKNYFVLFGFCVLAAIYSKTFLENLNAKVNQLTEETQKAKDNVKQLEEETAEAKDKVIQFAKEAEEAKSKAEEAMNRVEKEKNIRVKKQKMEREYEESTPQESKHENYNGEDAMLAVASSVTFDDNVKY